MEKLCKALILLWYWVLTIPYFLAVFSKGLNEEQYIRFLLGSLLIPLRDTNIFFFIQVLFLFCGVSKSLLVQSALKNYSESFELYWRIGFQLVK